MKKIILIILTASICLSCSTYNTIGTACVDNKDGWTRAQGFFSQYLPASQFIYQGNTVIRIWDHYDSTRWVLTKEGDSFCIYHYQNKPQVIPIGRQTDGIKYIWIYRVNDPEDEQLKNLLKYINTEK